MRTDFRWQYLKYIAAGLSISMSQMLRTAYVYFTSKTWRPKSDTPLKMIEEQRSQVYILTNRMEQSLHNLRKTSNIIASPMEFFFGTMVSPTTITFGTSTSPMKLVFSIVISPYMKLWTTSPMECIKFGYFGLQLTSIVLWPSADSNRL
jgi:hypothetical protein